MQYFDHASTIDSDNNPDFLVSGSQLVSMSEPLVTCPYLPSEVFSEEEREFLHPFIENSMAQDASSFWGIQPHEKEIAIAILGVLPDRIRRLHIPLIGNGCFFWQLCTCRRWAFAALSDVEQSAVDVYRTVRDNSEDLLRRLASMPVSENPQFRPQVGQPDDLDCVEYAVQVIRAGAFADSSRLCRKSWKPGVFARHVRLTEQERVISCGNVLRDVPGISLEHASIPDTVSSAAYGDVVIISPPTGFAWRITATLLLVFELCNQGEFCALRRC